MAKTYSSKKVNYDTEGVNGMRGITQQAYISSEIEEYITKPLGNGAVVIKTKVTVYAIHIVDNNPFKIKKLYSYEEPLSKNDMSVFGKTPISYTDVAGQQGLLANIKRLADKIHDKDGNSLLIPTYYGLKGDDILSEADFINLIPSLPEYKEVAEETPLLDEDGDLK